MRRLKKEMDQSPERNAAPQPCVFFDRDGVLNVDTGYVHRSQDFQWIPGAIEAIKWCHDRGYLTIVVTNQAGIARGFYDEAAFADLMDWVQGELAKHGARLDAVYHCPHHPTAGTGPLTRTCACRKPAGGLIHRAITEWNIDPARSLMIGDKPSDLAAAASCGVAGRLFPGGNLLAFVRDYLTPECLPR